MIFECGGIFIYFDSWTFQMKRRPFLFDPKCLEKNSTASQRHIFFSLFNCFDNFSFPHCCTFPFSENSYIAHTSTHTVQWSFDIHFDSKFKMGGGGHYTALHTNQMNQYDSAYKMLIDCISLFEECFNSTFHPVYLASHFTWFHSLTCSLALLLLQTKDQA